MVRPRERTGGARTPAVQALAPTHADRRFPRNQILPPKFASARPRRARIERGEVNALTYLYGYFTRLLAAGRREEGQTMAEYGVILAVITVAIIAVLVLLSDGIRNNLQAVVDVLS